MAARSDGFRFVVHLAELAWIHGGSWLSPARCAACRASVGATAVFCPRCASLVERRAAKPAYVEASGGVSFPLTAPFHYGGPLASAIAQLKYEGRSESGPRLGRLLAAHVAPLASRIDLVVTVPLHPRRLWTRGFDQAALLASPVARRLAVPCGLGVLRRTRDTPRQASLPRSHRLTNVVGAFAASAAVAKRRVLLIDDVCTTGATLCACARALEDAGARAITAAVLAVRDDDLY